MNTNAQLAEEKIIQSRKKINNRPNNYVRQFIKKYKVISS